MLGSDFTRQNDSELFVVGSVTRYVVVVGIDYQICVINPPFGSFNFFLKFKLAFVLSVGFAVNGGDSRVPQRRLGLQPGRIVHQLMVQ